MLLFVETTVTEVTTTVVTTETTTELSITTKFKVCVDDERDTVTSDSPLSTPLGSTPVKIIDLDPVSYKLLY